MSIIATKVKQTRNSKAEQVLWRLSEPVGYDHDWKTNEPAGFTEHVITSAAVVMFTGPETYIFPADEEGEVIDWGEMSGSYRGGLDHEKAISEAGWVVGGAE